MFLKFFLVVPLFFNLFPISFLMFPNVLAVSQLFHFCISQIHFRIEHMQLIPTGWVSYFLLFYIIFSKCLQFSTFQEN